MFSTRTGRAPRTVKYRARNSSTLTQDLRAKTYIEAQDHQIAEISRKTRGVGQVLDPRASPLRPPGRRTTCIRKGSNPVQVYVRDNAPLHLAKRALTLHLFSLGRGVRH